MFTEVDHSARTWALVLAIVLLVPASARTGQRSAPSGGSVTVQLLAFNDFHGHLEPPSGTNGAINGVAAGGAEYLATHLEQAVAENPNTIIVASGDLIGASPLTSSLFHDEPTIEAMNALHLAVASVGNHEFDEGWRETLRMQRGGCHPRDGCQDGDGFSGAAFTYLSANVLRTATKTTLFPATVLKTVGGVKIGFIGETLKGTNQIVSPAANRGVVFLDEASTANRYAARLKRQGADVVALLIHQGGRQHTEKGRALDPNGCENFGGSLMPILDKLSRDIQIVVAGHSHVFYNCHIGDRLVTSASSFGRMITRIQTTVDRSTPGPARITATNQIVTRDVARNPAQTAILAKYSAPVEERASRIVGSVTADLSRAVDQNGESPLGGVIADAQLASEGAKAAGAVVAFMNDGGVRADIVATPPRPGSPPGAVRFRDLFTVQPFSNTLTVVTMSGRTIKRLLEQQFDNPAAGQRKMLQVSSGFSYAYRLSAPAGQHVDAASIRIGNRPVAPTDRVRVAASDFLIDGGDAFTAFAEGTNRVTLGSDLDALVDYFRARSPISPPTERRVVRLDP
jgi:5'-nucleotidase